MSQNSSHILNGVYPSIKAGEAWRAVEDLNFTTALSIDSFVAGLQPAQPGAIIPTAVAQLGILTELDRLPDGVVMYLHLHSVHIDTQQAASDNATTGLQFFYIDTQNQPHYLTSFYNTQQNKDVILERLFPLSITSATLTNIGGLQGKVTVTSSVGTHAVTYNVTTVWGLVYRLAKESLDGILANEFEALKRQVNEHTELVLHEELQRWQYGMQPEPAFK